MKKSFALLVTMGIIMLFSTLMFSLFEINALKSENLKNEYLHTQARLHMEFLKSVATNLENKSIQTLEFSDKLFELKIEVYETSMELFVKAKAHAVSLHHKIIK